MTDGVHALLLCAKGLLGEGIVKLVREVMHVRMYLETVDKSHTSAEFMLKFTDTVMQQQHYKHINR